MDVNLDPRIEQKVEAFGRRRRQLIILRGIYASVATAIVTLSAVALLDYLVFLEDGTRYTLSLIAYTFVGLVLWFTCLRWLRHKPDRRRLARLFETADPEFHESLLSAVELGDPLFGKHWDSEAFRAVLQDEVAEHVEGISILGLLPTRLISRWVQVVLVAAAVFLGLLVIPGMRYYLLFFRALVPGANVERVSNVQVRVLEPATGDRVVPQGDPVSVVIELSDPHVEMAVLESIPERGASGVAHMQAMGNRRFTTTVQVARESVRYRIRAGDALTRKYLLSALPRPQISEFRKSYKLPAYTRLPDRTVAEANGDIEALENTEVTLQLRPNVAVKSAQLLATLGGARQEIPLTMSGGGRLLKAVFPVTRSGSYKVQLVAAGSGFENRFNPEYEIRLRPDLLPRVTLDSPAADQTVQPEDIIEVKGSAQDDVALAAVTVAYRLNQGAWLERGIEKDPVKMDVKVESPLDLFKFGLKPGDRIAVKLIAVDRRGNRAESVTRLLTFRAPGYDLARLGPLGAMNQLRTTLQALNKAAGALDARGQAVVGEWNAAAETTQRKQVLSRLWPAFQDAGGKAGEATELVRDALRKVGPGPEGADLTLVGRVLSLVQRQGFEAAQARVQFAAGSDDQRSAQPQVQEAGTRLHQTASQTAVLERDYAALLAAAEAWIALDQLRQMDRDEAQIARLMAAASRDARFQERVGGRQASLYGQVKIIATLFESLATKPAPAATRVAPVRQAFLTAIPKADAPAKQVAQGTTAALVALQPIADELLRDADRAREELSALLGNSADRVRDAAKSVEELVGKIGATDPEKAATAARAQDALKQAAAELRDRASLEELRQNADTRFVKDATQAADALDSVRGKVTDPVAAAPQVEPLQKVEGALRTLEAAHDVGEVQKRLGVMAEKERDPGRKPEESTALAKEWKSVDRQLQALQETAKKASLPVDAQRVLGEVAKGPEAELVRKEMTERENPQHAASPVADPLERAALKLADAREKAEPALASAREALARTAPALGAQLENLARAASQLEDRTAALAAKAPQLASTELQGEARKQMEAQMALNERLDLARDALRRDANAQDLSADTGRDRARDADDALALLRQPPPKAEGLLRQAAEATDPSAQAAALTQAGEQQAKLADNLEQIAQHYKSLEKSEDPASRKALRRAEEAMGLKPGLDQEYARAERLSETAQSAPDRMLSRLERELSRDPAMRRELQQIADQTLDNAARSLKDVSADEKAMKDNVARLAMTQLPQTKSLSDAAKDMAERAFKLSTGEIPDLARQAKAGGLENLTELERAAKTVYRAAEQMPTDLANPQAKVAEDMGAAAKAFEGAQKDLQASAQKAAAALQTAQQAVQQAQGEQNNALGLAQQAVQRAQGELQAAQNQAQPLAQQVQNELAQAKAAADQLQQAAAAAEKALKTAQATAADAAKEKTEADKALEKAEAAADRRAPGAEQKVAQALQRAAQADAGDAAARRAADEAAQKAAVATESAKQAAETWKEDRDLAAVAQQWLRTVPGAQGAAPVSPVKRTEEPARTDLSEQAQALAAKAAELAAKTIPRMQELAKQAGVADTQNLQRAAQKLDDVALRLPTALANPTPEQAQQVANAAQAVEQARQEIQGARERLDGAALAAEQSADKAQADVQAATRQAAAATAAADAAKAAMKAAAQDVAKAAERAVVADAAVKQAEAKVAQNPAVAQTELPKARQALEAAKAAEAAEKLDVQKEGERLAAAKQAERQADQALATAQQNAKAADQALAAFRTGPEAQSPSLPALARQVASSTGDLSKAATALANEVKQEAVHGVMAEAVQKAADALQAARQAADAAQKTLTEAQGQKPQSPVAPDVANLAKAADASELELAGQAQALARDLEQLQKQALPAVRDFAAAAGVDAKRELAQAAQALQQASAALPKDFSAPKPETVQKLGEVARALEQGRNELQNAVTKAEAAADQAQTAAEQARDNLAVAKVADQQARQSADSAKAAADAARAGVTKAADQRGAAERALQRAQEETAAGKAGAPEALQRAQAEAQQAQNAVAQAQQVAQQAAQQAAAAAAAAKDAAGAAVRAQAAAAGAEQALAKAEGRAVDKPETGLQAARNAAQGAEAARRDAADLTADADRLVRQEQTQDAVRQAMQALEKARQAGERAQDQIADVRGAAAKGAPDAVQRTQGAAQAAGELTQRTAQLANQLQALSQQTAPPLRAAAKEQDQLQDEVRKAAEDIARSGRHQERLGNDAAHALQEVGEQTRVTADSTMETAQKALQQADLAGQAQAAVNRAQAEVQQDLGALREAMQRATESMTATAPKGTPAPEQATDVSRWLARALDRLDQPSAAEGTSRPVSGQPPPSAQGAATPAAPATQAAAKNAMQQAMQAQASAMATARNSGQVPGEQNMSPASNGGDTRPEEPKVAGPEGPDEPVKLAAISPKDEWGKLPGRLARDLMDAKGENVPAEYRTMVETYYRVIAEKGKDKER